MCLSQPTAVLVGTEGNWDVKTKSRSFSMRNSRMEIAQARGMGFALGFGLVVTAGATTTPHLALARVPRGLSRFPLTLVGACRVLPRPAPPVLRARVVSPAVISRDLPRAQEWVRVFNECVARSNEAGFAEWLGVPADALDVGLVTAQP